VSCDVGVVESEIKGHSAASLDPRIGDVELTQPIVRELLDYDPESGVLTWRWRNREWFSSDRIWNSWNAKNAGKRAFTARDTYGHAHGAILGKLYLAHRIIWLWMTGRWPDLTIDHLNHQRADNRWHNLELVTVAENNARRRRSGPKIGTTGRAGIQLEKRTRQPSYVATIGAGRGGRGRRIHLGTFRTLEAAQAARRAAEQPYLEVAE
jgi:hypothetical protein